jgi:NADPH:quinone reductase-like Zn-dependent oxidoreductase
MQRLRVRAANLDDGATMRAVRFNQYGDEDVLQVVEVPRPVPGPGQVLVQVRAAGINPGEAKIRDGAVHEIFPATFPSGEGSDLAGVVVETGDGVDGFAPGDEVVGFTDTRSSHADYALVEATNLVPRAPGVPWEVAGAVFVVGTTAIAAVRSVGAGPGDVVVVAGAAGGVGSLAAQLAQLAGARVLGIAGAADGPWLREHGIEPINYAGDVAAAIRASTDRVDAFIDTAGHGNVALALDLGVARDRVDTVIDFAAAAQFGVKTDGGATAASADTLAELLGLLADGRLELPIGRTFPLDQVREAYRFLDTKHGHGKVVLIP